MLLMIGNFYIVQIYIKLMEMKMMQSTKYNFLALESVQDILKQLNTSGNITEVV